MAGVSKGAHAYRKVYGRRIRGAAQHAHRLTIKDEVQKRIMELKEKSAAKSTLDNQERREIIATRARADDMKDSDLAAFLHLDAKLAGDLTERTETTLIGDPNAPIVVQLPTIITTPRPRAQRKALPESEAP
jgi:hypothetical protein